MDTGVTEEESGRSSFDVVEHIAKAEWEWERLLHDDPTPDWQDIAEPLRRSRLRHAEYMLNVILTTAALTAMHAKLPEGYQWGRDAMEQFNFGKRRAAEAILALSPGKSPMVLRDVPAEPGGKDG